MTDTPRPVPVEIGPDGRTRARVTMTPSSNTQRVSIEVPPDQAIPIVFVPGIMGSPLLATGENAQVMGEDNRWAWFPDDALGWVAGMTRWKSYSRLTPAERKRLLSPADTRALSTPEDADRETVAKHCSTLYVEEALQRGWGSVMLGSYGAILNFLEAQLRYILTPQGQPYPGIQGAMPREPADWGELKGYVPLDPERLRQAAEFRYPVYAVGYNWLNSNADAADYLAERIRAILERCQRDTFVKCQHGVILVTHSMGGLVARLCAKRYPQLIQGVVHGVQPATGAATAYRRVRAGWEDLAGAIGLGGTGRKIMPVFANAAGPLELLPSQRYGSGWLRVTCNGKELLQLPRSSPDGTDPYTQIYLEPDAWWRLMDPAWIDPAGDGPNTDRGSIKNAWSNYQEMTNQAKEFHAELHGYYHPNSYVHYGADEDYPSFRCVTWDLKGSFIAYQLPGQSGTRATLAGSEHAANLRLVDDNHEGRVRLVNDQSEQQWINQHGVGVVHDTRGDSYIAELQGQDQGGDGTVPAHSAEDAEKRAVFAARMHGYEHQGSYADARVQRLTLYCVLSIGAQARELSPT